MADNKEVLIAASSADFSYPGAGSTAPPALSGISLNVEKGDYIALLGPNGSGKTTLLKLFNALLRPTGGKVVVNGLDTALEENLPEIRRFCGMIFQNPDNQLVATTVEEDLAFGPENLALEPALIRKRVDAVAEKLNLVHLLAQPPHLLSGGEKQRVAIGGVLAMQPRCLLMDEPTAMLDPAGRKDVLSTVARLNAADGLAVIHVTHYPEEAALAKKVILLEKGRLLAAGSPEDILTDLSLLRRLGLNSTAAAELAAILRSEGFDLPPKLLFSRELVHHLCSSEQNS